MQNTLITRTLYTEEDSRNFARQFAEILTPGDVLLLEGDIGAGKTFFARSVIQHLLGSHEDVPSPTFTIVQTYQTENSEIWHCDLYRLTTPDEAIELGLDEAFEEAISMIEWPDRLGDLAPTSALTLHFEAHETFHTVEFTPNNAWAKRLEKHFAE